MMKSMCVYMLVLVCAVNADEDEDVFTLPLFIRQPNSVFIWKGDKIMLPCFALGYPRPEVTWYKDGVPVKLIIGSVSSYILADDTLVINKARNNANHTDSGDYYCNATNSAGSTQSRIATVKVISDVPVKSYVHKFDNQSVQLSWSSPPNLNILSYKISCLYNHGRAPFILMYPKKQTTSTILSGLDPYESYYVFVQIKTKSGYGKRSNGFVVELARM
ncbi:contactin-5-like [Hydractinia symbiolongicarpus]|uniref:contactin-5-like n=1 Tax=Hydractinia symbiolongicarpus TaxID=13093 RepID=UPI00254DCAA6|nr:contactin-5-like [Hydractinia symbiolongicarpus]